MKYDNNSISYQAGFLHKTKTKGGNMKYDNNSIRYQAGFLHKTKTKGGNMKYDNNSIRYQAGFLLILISGFITAAVVPVAGDLAFDLYDVAVNDILDGPIGYIAGVAAILYAGYAFSTSKIAPAIMATLGGAMVLQTDTITQTLGATVHLIG